MKRALKTTTNSIYKICLGFAAFFGLLMFINVIATIVLVANA